MQLPCYNAGMERIGIMVENSRAYGRAMIEGIAAFAQETHNWILRPLTVEEAFTPKLREFDGIIARIADDRLTERLVHSALPTVDVFCQRVHPGIAGVDSDHASIGAMARNLFVSRGFQNLAFCGIPGVAFSDMRQKAFADDKTFVFSLRTPHPTDESQFFAERLDRTPDAAQLRRWIRRLPRPIAVFCCNDLRAIQLQRIIRECGFRVPQDFALLGVDNDTIACSYAEIPISSIDPNSFRVGFDAARILCAMLTRRPDAKPHPIHRVKPGDIIERTSSEFMPIDPPWLGTTLMHIERNLHRPIGAREIFHVAGRSSTHVENVFHRRLGCSVQSYVNTKKLREAQRLLATTGQRISEIAFQCGFASPQYFCRVFTTAYGISPKAYRVRPASGRSR